MKAWSYSALTQFENCPRQYYLLRVTKQAQDVKGEAALWGDQVHKHLEARAKSDTPLPKFLAHLDPLVARILAAPGEKLIEKQIALTENFKPTSWFAKDVWVRGIVDAGTVAPPAASALDWKTGKRKPDSTQMKLFSGLMFAQYPDVEVVHTGFVWLKDKKLDRETFTREQVPVIWAEFLPRVERLESAFERDAWPPRPSGLCKKHCPVGRALCTYCGT